jgi:glycosyltransferase involved in cell wall biosynthesis
MGERVRPLNVLWVIDHVCYDGSLHGGGRLYWNLLPKLDPRRVRVVPCLLRASDEIRRVFRDSPVPVRILDKGKFDPTTLLTFLRLIREERIDVMHLHCYGASTFGRMASVLTGVPAVVQDYDTEVYFPYPSYLWAADVMLARSTSRAIAASPMVKKFLVEKRKIAPERIDMMFHAVPADRFMPVPAERIRALRRELGVGDSARVVGTLTKLGPQRGNEYLIEVAGEVIRSVPEALFVVVYRPTLYHRLPSKRYVPITDADRDGQVDILRSMARAKGVEASIRFIEWSDALQDFMAACDIVVAPFLSERFSSVSLLEALAMGKPLVATDLGEQREIVRNGFNGYLVRPGDVTGMSDRLVHLLTNGPELERMARQARTDAEQYSAAANARRLETMYLELASSRGASAMNPASSGTAAPALSGEPTS